MKKILSVFLCAALVILSAVSCITVNAYDTHDCCQDENCTTANHCCCCCCCDCEHTAVCGSNVITSHTHGEQAADHDCDCEQSGSENAYYTDFMHFHAKKGHNITLFLGIRQCEDIEGIWCEIRHDPNKLKYTGYEAYYDDTVNTTVSAGYNLFSILFSPNGTNMTDEKTIISFSYTLITDVEDGDNVLSYTIRELFDSDLNNVNYQCLSYWVENNSISIVDTDSSSPHIHSPVVHPAVPETCTTEGYSEWVDCSTCGEVLTPRLVIPPRGHKDEVILPVDPTCTEPGQSEYYKCSVCGEILVPPTVIPPLGHLEVKDPAQEPTCTHTGLTEGSHCSRCGLVLKAQEEIPTVPHKFVDGYCIYCGIAEFDKPTPIGIYGDVNGDEKITARDALLILRYAIKLTTLTDVQIAVSDVNGDGKANTSDAMLIQRYAIGITTNSKIGDYCY